MSLDEYVEPLLNLSTVSCDLEQFWREIRRPFTKPIWLCTCYRPPNGSAQSAFDELSAYLQILDEKCYTAEVIMLGDCNVDYFKTLTADFKHMKDFEHKAMLTQFINCATRITNKIKSTID